MHFYLHEETFNPHFSLSLTNRIIDSSIFVFLLVSLFYFEETDDTIMYPHFLQYLKYIWHIYQIVINTWKIGRYFGEIMNLKYKCSTVNMNIFLSMVECSRLSTSLWHGNLTPKAPMCFLHDT